MDHIGKIVDEVMKLLDLQDMHHRIAIRIVEDMKGAVDRAGTSEHDPIAEVGRHLAANKNRLFQLNRSDQFITECCECGLDYEVKARGLWDAYRSWEKSPYQIDERDFYNTLVGRKGLSMKWVSKDDDPDTQILTFKGVRLKGDSPSMPKYDPIADAFRRSEEYRAFLYKTRLNHAFHNQEDQVNDYVYQYNRVDEFIAECCERDVNYRMVKSDLFQAYAEWMEKLHGLIPDKDMFEKVIQARRDFSVMDLSLKGIRLKANDDVAGD